MTPQKAYNIGKAIRAELLAYNFEEELAEAFEHFSQFSPWELTAKSFDEAENPEEVWESFEKGLYGGDL